MLRILLCAVVAAASLGAQTAPERYDGTPLLRARNALEMARAAVLEDRWADAASALRLTSKALADYEKLSPGPHAETAHFIRQEIDAYVPHVVREHVDALERIDIWRLPVDKWYADVHKQSPQ